MSLLIGAVLVPPVALSRLKTMLLARTQRALNRRGFQLSVGKFTLIPPCLSSVRLRSSIVCNHSSFNLSFFWVMKALFGGQIIHPGLLIALSLYKNLLPNACRVKCVFFRSMSCAYQQARVALLDRCTCSLCAVALCCMRLLANRMSTAGILLLPS